LKEKCGGCGLGQCTAITQKGHQCTRNATGHFKGKNLCTQHLKIMNAGPISD
jgi:hypothetical protein